MTEAYRRLIVEREGNPYRLGRHVHHDPRNRSFAIDAHKVTIITNAFWKPNDPTPLNQNRYWDGTKYISLGSCTGNAAGKAASCAPFTNKFDEQYAVDNIYAPATQIDPFPGQYPPTDTGSDGQSVMKVLQSRGVIGSYWWGFNIDQILAGLMSGPCIFGIEWREGMFTPDARGRIKPSGAVAGGHEICCFGWDNDNQEFFGPNSWGPDWGATINDCPGCWRMRIDDMAALMVTGGDCCFPKVA